MFFPRTDILNGALYYVERSDSDEFVIRNLVDSLFDIGNFYVIPSMLCVPIKSGVLMNSPQAFSPN